MIRGDSVHTGGIGESLPRPHQILLLSSSGEHAAVGIMLRGVSRAEAELRCAHVGLMRPRMPRTVGCDRCEARRATWEGLRLCSSCGNVGCCEKSRHHHADRHFRETGHPVIETLGLKLSWWSCLVDQVRVFA